MAVAIDCTRAHRLMQKSMRSNRSICQIDLFVFADDVYIATQRFLEHYADEGTKLKGSRSDCSHPHHEGAVHELSADSSQKSRHHSIQTDQQGATPAKTKRNKAKNKISKKDKDKLAWGDPCMTHQQWE